MSESASEKRMVVTAQERAHPALQKLARAAIALARLELRRPRPEVTPADQEGPR
ncbi:hypothetical protein GCM10023192_73500 [Amycolatopsis samaneae]